MLKGYHFCCYFNISKAYLLKLYFNTKRYKNQASFLMGVKIQTFNLNNAIVNTLKMSLLEGYDGSGLQTQLPFERFRRL